MRKTVLTVLLAVAYGCFPNIAAKERDSSQDSGFEKYELSFSGAFLPGRWTFGYDFLYSGTHSSIPEIYRDYAYREKEFTYGVWTAAFTCNFSSIIALEASLSYEGGGKKTYRKSGAIGFPEWNLAHDTLAMSESRNYLTPVLLLKLHWLNRRYVRMYSSFGAGVAFCISGDRYRKGDEQSVVLLPSFQLNPLGICAGKRFYALAEIGIGTVFTGVRLGAGYRF